MSVKSHLTLEVSLRPENAVTYSAGQNYCGVFSETVSLPRLSASSLRWPYIGSAIFPADNTHARCAYASPTVQGDRCCDAPNVIAVNSPGILAL